MSQELTDKRFAELLNPVRDLTKNWDIDVAHILETYIHMITDKDIVYQDGQGTMNFAEAALLVQASVHVYGRKVDFLCNLAKQVLDLLASRNLHAGASKEKEGGGGGGKKSKRVIDGDDGTELHKIDILSKISTKKLSITRKDDQVEKKKTVNFLTEIPIEAEEKEQGTKKMKVNLFGRHGDPIGFKAEFWMNSILDSSTHSLLLNHPAGRGRKVFCGPVPEEFPLDITVNSEAASYHGDMNEDPPVDAGDDFHDDGGSQSDGDVDHRGPDMFSITPEAPDADVAQEAVPEKVPDFRGEENTDGENPERQDGAEPEGPVENAVAKDVADEIKVGAEAVKEASGKDKGKAKAELWEMDTPDFTRPGSTKGKPLAARRTKKTGKSKKPSGDETVTEYICHKIIPPPQPYAVIFQAQYQKERGVREEEQVADWPQPEDVVTQVNEPDPPEGEEDNGGDDDAGEFFDLPPLEDTPPENVENDEASQCSQDESADDGLSVDESYHQLIKGKVQEYTSAAQSHMQPTEVAKRVSAWHSKLQPMLEVLEGRPDFDIHEYGTKILDGFPDSGAKVTLTFEDVLPMPEKADDRKVENRRRRKKAEEPKTEVHRYFLSILQLANTYNLEITQSKPMAPVELTMLSTKRHHHELSEYEAPSQQQSTIRKNRKRKSGGGIADSSSQVENSTFNMPVTPDPTPPSPLRTSTSGNIVALPQIKGRKKKQACT